MKSALRKLLFPVATFVATVVLMSLQKPLFLARYAEAGTTFGDWVQVYLHGLVLDSTVAGYITALPLLVVLVSLWVTLPQRVTQRIMQGYFVVVALITALITAGDLALYAHWGFRIDSTIFIYLVDPKEAMASVDLATALPHLLAATLYAALMIVVYRKVVRLLPTERLGYGAATLWSVVMLCVMGLDFVAVRGGVHASTANVSKVYFSDRMLLNHSAINPVFSLLSTLGDCNDLTQEYPFYEADELAERFETIRGNRPPEQQESSPHEATDTLLTMTRPNVVIVLMESVARTVMEAEVEGVPVMPQLQRLRHEGIWFENLFANSFRTDRGEVAVLSGYPAQTRMSIMKLPNKSRSLPSIARSLARAGYRTSFSYGGDPNFTNQASYFYATGWQEVIGQGDLKFDVAPANWGWDDRTMGHWFAERVIRLADESRASGIPFLAGWLTLSSHTPFDVPEQRFDDKELNAMAFTDDCIGALVERLKASPEWENLLLVLVSDHGFPYPKTLLYNEPLRHRIPMIWTGGAAKSPATITVYGSQQDLCATLLGQLGIEHDDYDFSRDLLDSRLPHFGYYTFNDGFGVVDATGEVVWDAATKQVVRGGDARLEAFGRTMLQQTYQDIAAR